MGFIASVQARQILDSRGNPTIEVDVITDAGIMGRAAVPSAHTSQRRGECQNGEVMRDGGPGLL